MKTMTHGARSLGRSSPSLALVAGVAAQQPPELIIRHGHVVTAVGRTEADLRIRNGTITEIGRSLTAASGARVMDAVGSRGGTTRSVVSDRRRR